MMAPRGECGNGPAFDIWGFCNLDVGHEYRRTDPPVDSGYLCITRELNNTDTVRSLCDALEDQADHMRSINRWAEVLAERGATALASTLHANLLVMDQSG